MVEDEALKIQAWFTEVQEEPDFLSGSLEVVDDLVSVVLAKVTLGLQLHDDLPEADEVGPIGAHGVALVVHGDLHFACCGNVAACEFQLQGGLIHGL